MLLCRIGSLFLLGAAAVASLITKQELFDSKLLNFLALYSGLKWTELAAEEKLVSLVDKVGIEEKVADDNDDEMVMVFLFGNPAIRSFLNNF